jgi:hypothetical protein
VGGQRCVDERVQQGNLRSGGDDGRAGGHGRAGAWRVTSNCARPPPAHARANLLNDCNVAEPGNIPAATRRIVGPKYGCLEVSAARVREGKDVPRIPQLAC